MKRAMAALIAAAALLAGCAVNPTGATPVNAKEEWVVAETSRLSALLHKNITGVIVDVGRVVAAGTGGCPVIDNPRGYCDAAAWYGPPVYYWRTYVNHESTTFNDLTNTAAHEVCHSLTLGHNPLLWNCIRSLGADPQFSPVGG